MANETQTQTDAVSTAIAAEETLSASLRALGLAPTEALAVISALGTLDTLAVETIDASGLPTALVALTALQARVGAERRADITVSVKDLRMNARGQLSRQSDTPVFRYATRHALCQIANRLPRHPAYAGPYWSSIPSEPRAVEFARVVAENVVAGKGNYKLTLRLRKPDENAEHYVYAAVSERFTAYNPNQLASDMLEALGANAGRVKASVWYDGLTTAVRLVLRNVSGFGVLGTVSTADDGTESIHVGAELLLPSGARYIGTARTAASYRHLGGQTTVEQIREGLDQIDEICEPWIQLWQDAEATPVADMAEALAVLTAAGSTRKRGAWLKVADVTPDALHAEVAAFWAEAQAGNVPGYRARSTQAGLAELLLLAATQPKFSAPMREAFQNAGTQIAGMAAYAFQALITPKTTHGIAVDNQALADRIAGLAQGEAAKWNERANAAEAAGDVEAAEVARERAELRLVEGDALIEHMQKTKPFEF
jgi:hypothetical protein